MGSVVALLPTLPPDSNRVEVPASMKPEDQATLLRELSTISTAITKAEVRAEEREKAAEQRFRAAEARLRRLEDEAETTGRHEITKLQAELKERKTEAAKWKWWILSIAATLITSTIVGLVVHFFATR